MYNIFCIIVYLIGYGFIAGITNSILIEKFGWDAHKPSDPPGTALAAFFWPITISIYIIVFLPSKAGNALIVKIFADKEKPTTF